MYFEGKADAGDFGPRIAKGNKTGWASFIRKWFHFVRRGKKKEHIRALRALRRPAKSPVRTK